MVSASFRAPLAMKAEMMAAISEAIETHNVIQSNTVGTIGLLFVQSELRLRNCFILSRPSRRVLAHVNEKTPILWHTLWHSPLVFVRCDPSNNSSTNSPVK